MTIDFDLMEMRREASFSKLIGNVTASHIRRCVLPGSNVGVASQTPSFLSFPVGMKEGTYDRTFDMSWASNYNAAYITKKGGIVGSAFNALVAGLDEGKASLNVHTSSFPGGEIRGLLVPAPEPETYALMLAGLGVLGWAARRKQLRG